MSMSQRLSDEAITSLVNPVTGKIAVHPRSGEPIVPIGLRSNGLPIFPIMGGSGEEDDANDDDSDDDSSGDDDSDDDDDSSDDEDDPEGSDKSGKGSKEDDEDKRDPQRKIEALEDEKNRHFRGRKRAERRVDELEKEVAELKKNGTGDDKLKEQVSTLETEKKTLSSNLREAQLQIAFLKDNTYEWHNPGTALKMVNLSDVEIDDDGTAHGMKAALEELAKSDPYLVKEKESKKTDPPRKSGQPPKKKAGTKDPKDRKTLSSKYPGLRR